MTGNQDERAALKDFGNTVMLKPPSRCGSSEFFGHSFPEDL
jgi:hypothetical protein